MRPGKHFADVEMQVLARFGDSAIDRPGADIAGQDPEHVAFAALGIDERIEQPLEWIALAGSFCGDGHRTTVMGREWRARAARSTRWPRARAQSPASAGRACCG